MRAIDDGGPAFPSAPTVGPNGDLWRPVDIGCEGATLRDYFATKALPFELTKSNDYDTVARRCFSVADAMLKARGAV